MRSQTCSNHPNACFCRSSPTPPTATCFLCRSSATQNQSPSSKQGTVRRRSVDLFSRATQSPRCRLPTQAGACGFCELQNRKRSRGGGGRGGGGGARKRRRVWSRGGAGGSWGSRPTNHIQQATNEKQPADSLASKAEATRAKHETERCAKRRRLCTHTTPANTRK